MSLINYDGDSLYCGNYVSDVFDTNTGIWWHCDDDNTTQISDLTKGVYTRESHTKNWCQYQQMHCLLFILEQAIWQNTALFIFKNSQPCPKSILTRRADTWSWFFRVRHNWQHWIIWRVLRIYSWHKWFQLQILNRKNYQTGIILYQFVRQKILWFRKHNKFN